ncbi:MAG TPA: dephospho-CoA kinase [Bryobacteraceae bacterium]|nr:dephospho-CoA kinase [Bryobacteraceae bacterium]
MIRAGLTGGMACGKSFVASALADLGCHVVRADELGHQALLPGGAAYAPVVDEFGAGIVDASGHIDRKLLAAQVFGNPERLASLNAIVHPAVIEMQEQFLAAAERVDPTGIGIVEAAILIETGSYRRFHKLIVVTCTVEQQIQRAVHRDGCTPEQARNRLSRQLPVEEKTRFADYVIDTSGEKQRTLEQTRAVFESLRSLAK